MKTPLEKYNNDSTYRQLVNTLTHFIEVAQFSPSELREAAVLASIRYEERRARPPYYDPKIEAAFHTLREFVTAPKK